MTDLEKAKLLKIYEIVETFKDCYEQEVRPKMQSLFMTSDYEDLNTARGMLGELIDEDIVAKLMVSKTETRNALRKAYEICTTLDNNVIDEAEDLKRVLIELRTCYYVILNSTYDMDNPAQEVFNKTLEICEYGLQLLDILKSKTEETYQKYYINPYLETTICENVNILIDTFNMLRPLPEELKNKGETRNND